MTTLRDLSGLEAFNLAKEYTNQLALVGAEIDVDELSPTQSKIIDGLYYYWVLKHAEYDYQVSSDAYKPTAKYYMEADAAIVLECEPFVNQWLTQGQPLDIGWEQS